MGLNNINIHQPHDAHNQGGGTSQGATFWVTHKAAEARVISKRTPFARTPDHILAWSLYHIIISNDFVLDTLKRLLLGVRTVNNLQ